MYCANCGKTFRKREPVTPTVMPGWNKPVPTCYDDRLCYPRYKEPAVVIQLVVHKPSIIVIPSKIRFKDNKRGLAKYLRKYKFKGR